MLKTSNQMVLLTLALTAAGIRAPYSRCPRPGEVALLDLMLAKVSADFVESTDRAILHTIVKYATAEGARIYTGDH